MTGRPVASQQLDMQKVTAFARQLAMDMGGAHLIALAYLADRLGIFHAMADGEPLTSQQLAERTGLNERYLREWASAMAAAQYIDYNPKDATFRLAPEQRLVLVEERSPFFFAGGFQYAQACLRQLPRLMDAFKNGGGIPFADFGPEIVQAIQRLFAGGYEMFVASQWIPAVPDVHERVKAGAKVAEVGCGAGQSLIPIAKAFPNSQFVGYDNDPTSIEQATGKAVEAGVADRVSFKLAAAEEMGSNSHFDLIMAFNCIHDMVNPRGALAGIRGAMKETGAFLWSEANASHRLEDNINPMGRLLYATSTMHCMTVSLAHGGEGLGSVLGEVGARALAEEAGFASFQRLPIEHPFHQLFLLRK